MLLYILGTSYPFCQGPLGIGQTQDHKEKNGSLTLHSTAQIRHSVFLYTSHQDIKTLMECSSMYNGGNFG